MELTAWPRFAALGLAAFARETGHQACSCNRFLSVYPLAKPASWRMTGGVRIVCDKGAFPKWQYLQIPKSCGRMLSMKNSMPRA
jgi:hypothetical protein